MSQDINADKFCPEVSRACPGWLNGSCAFADELSKAQIFHVRNQSRIGDTPIVNRLVADRERKVNEKYEFVAERLAYIVLAAGHEFDSEQCRPVSFASGMFQISPIGQVGVLPPDPRMSSRPIYVDGWPSQPNDDDEDDKTPKPNTNAPKMVTLNLKPPIAFNQ